MDGVVINRLLPDDGNGEFYNALHATQEKYRRVVDESFGALPRFAVPLYTEEIVGTALLARVADDLYADRDPAEFFYRGQPQRIERDGDDIILSVALPFMEGEAIDLHQRGDELDILVGWHKHHVTLPDMLARRTAAGAHLRDGTLRVRFIGDGKP